MRRGLGVLTSALLIAGLLSLGSAHHKPDHQIPPGQQTSTTESTTTTTETTTTTTTTVPTLELTEDLVVDGFTHTFSGTINANGFEIIVRNGGSLDWDGFTVNDAARIFFVDCAAPSTLLNGTVNNSGVAGELGFYPLHWHLQYDCSRGTLVDNVTVSGGQNHAFVPHGSHGITIRNSTALNTIDDAFWWDPPGTTRITCADTDKRRFCTDDNSNDLLWENVTVDGVVAAPGERAIELAGFVLGAGSGNTIRNATARNIEQDVNCSGFHWPSTANLNDGGNVWTAENLNGPSSGCHAVFVWQNDGSFHPIDGVTGGSVKHGAYKNDYEYHNIDVERVEIHAGGWSIVSGRIGHLIAQRQNKISPNDPTVLVENTTVDAFTVNNLDTSHTNTSTYVLNNTGLTCADVVYQSVQPGTRVIIDGGEC